MKAKLFLLLAGCVILVAILSQFTTLPTPHVNRPIAKKETMYTIINVYEPVVVPISKAQIDVPSDTNTTTKKTFGDIIKENWGALLFAFLALAEIIIRATPTDSDNSIFNLIKKLIDALIPNKSTSGGEHP